MIGRFHYVTGPREDGGGWWFEPKGQRMFLVIVGEPPPVERLVDAKFAEDGITVLSWSE